MDEPRTRESTYIEFETFSAEKREKHGHDRNVLTSHDALKSFVTLTFNLLRWENKN